MPGKKIVLKAVFRGVDKMSGSVSRMQRGFKRFTSSARRGLKRLSRGLKTVGRGIKSATKILAVGLGAVTGVVAGLVHQFSKLEDAEAAFTPLLGGAEKAKEMIDALNKTAASTPFQFENLSAATKQLLPVMNGDIEKTVKTLRMLGDTAGGNAQKLDTITRGFVKASLKGKVDMEALNMIAEAGVPIFQELAESMGIKTGEKFFKRISAGKVGVADLTKAFEKMTTEGGIFFGGMEIASKTTSGVISTLKDNLSLTAAELGKEFAPYVKEAATYLTGVAKSAKAWIIQNKEMIRSKIGTFVKEFVAGIKALYGWFSKFTEEHKPFEKFGQTARAIGKGISFIAENFQTIVNVLRIGLPLLIGFKTALFLMASAEALRGLAGISSGVAGIGTQATGAMGKVSKLTKGIGVLAAGAVGWQIGSIIHDQVLGPLADSRAELKRLLDETESRMGRAMKRGKVADVQNEVTRTQERVKKYASGASMEDVVSFFAGPTEFFENRLKTIIKASGDIKRGKEFVSKEVALQNEVLKESSSPVVKEYLRTGEVPDSAPSVVSPTESLSRSIEEKIEKSKTEITVKAAPGTSAEITNQKGTSSGLTLQTSGGI